jgi:acetyl esterase/lipase
MLTACLTAACAFSPCVFAQEEIPLWKDGATGPKHSQPEASEDRRETGRLDRYVSFVSNPTLTIYPASGNSSANPAVLIVPGGGFRYVCIDKEGHEVARWLNSIGVTAAVLKYRVLAPTTERSFKNIEAILPDTERAMRVLRHNASHWKIDPQKIGIMGFSAGGVMSIRLINDADAGDAASSDPVEKVSSRPNFVALIYTGLPGGKMPKADKTSPPFFIAHASDDPKAPAAVAAKIYLHLLENGASAELHMFSSGDHGFGVHPATGSARGWTAQYAAWLSDRGILKAEAPK